MNDVFGVKIDNAEKTLQNFSDEKLFKKKMNEHLN